MVCHKYIFVEIEKHFFVSLFSCLTTIGLTAFSWKGYCQGERGWNLEINKIFCNT